MQQPDLSLEASFSPDASATGGLSFCEAHFATRRPGTDAAVAVVVVGGVWCGWMEMEMDHSSPATCFRPFIRRVANLWGSVEVVSLAG